MAYSQLVHEPAVVLVLEGRVPAGGHHALEEFLAEARAYYESHDGNKVVLHWDAHDPCRFREIMLYFSEEAFQSDDERTRSDPTMLAFLERWHALMESGPIVSVWRPGNF